MKPSARVTLAFLLLLCVLQLRRVLVRVEVVAGGVAVPIWPRAAASLGTAAHAGWVWRDQRR